MTTAIARAPNSSLRGADARARRRAVVPPVLGALLLATALLCAARGGVAIPIRAIAAMLLARAGLGPGDAFLPTHEAILFAIRLPRVALGTLVGASLATAGASMQGIFRNPLVDPGLLGVSSGAALGAAAAFVIGGRLGLSSPLAPSLVAFAGGLVAMALVMRLGKTEGRASAVTLLLAGIAINALCAALTGALAYVASDAQLRSLTFWTLGSLGGASWSSALTLLALVAPPLVVLPCLARAMNALLLGESEAGYLGFSPDRTRRLVLAGVALLVGASVAVSGVVGFVGLAVPHIVRMVVGSDHRVLLPASAPLGAALVLIADLIARTAVVPAELPLGIVTACLGAPFFLVLLARERRRLA